MKVLRPTPFQSSMLISSNAVETYAAWLVGTTYAKYARVDRGTFYYESLDNANTGNDPLTSPTWWILVGPDNTHAMFDEQSSTQTVTTTPLEVVVATGVIDSIFFGNISAVSVNVIVRDGLAGPSVYEQTQFLNSAELFDWYQYFFYDPLIMRRQALFTGIPPFASSHVEVTIENGSADVSLGVMTFGTIYTLGTTEYGANSGIIDYSVKETDEFGNTLFVRRAFSKRLSARVWVDNYNMNRVQRALYDLRAAPAVWIGSDDPTVEEALVVYGFYRDFSMDITYATVSYCSLEIEGLI